MVHQHQRKPRNICNTTLPEHLKNPRGIEATADSPNGLSILQRQSNDPIVELLDVGRIEARVLVVETGGFVVDLAGCEEEAAVAVVYVVVREGKVNGAGEGEPVGC